MANSLYRQMMPQAAENSTNASMQSIKRMAEMLKGKQNPMQILQAVSQQNPAVAQVMNMINGSGMSAKQFFMQIANQQGVDINSVISMLK